MTQSAAQRALSVYEIVEPILRYASEDLSRDNMLSFQQTCSSWRTFIRRSAILHENQCLTGALAPQFSHTTDVSELPFGLYRIMWVYDLGRRQVSRMFTARNGDRDLRTAKTRSCQEMFLAWRGVELPVYWQPYGAHLQPLRFLGFHKTVRDVIEAIASYVPQRCTITPPGLKIAYIIHHTTFGDPPRLFIDAKEVPGAEALRMGRCMYPGPEWCKARLHLASDNASLISPDFL